MKKILVCLFMLIISVTMFTACGQNNNQNNNSNPPGIETPDNNNNEVKGMNKLKIAVGNKELIALLADNSSTRALKELIKDKPLTINMSDYAGFEKVGSLGTSLPTSNTQITTTVGDIMLYQGNSLVIFYGNNSWSYTRLGKIENTTREGLIAILGTGDVLVTLSLTK